MKLRLFTFSEILNPQPKAANVVHALLAWIDAADAASQSNQAKPEFVRPDGSPIFPEDEEWWLTELENDPLKLTLTLPATTLQTTT